MSAVRNAATWWTIAFHGAISKEWLGDSAVPEPASIHDILPFYVENGVKRSGSRETIRRIESDELGPGGNRKYFERTRRAALPAVRNRRAYLILPGLLVCRRCPLI